MSSAFWINRLRRQQFCRRPRRPEISHGILLLHGRSARFVVKQKAAHRLHIYHRSWVHRSWSRVKRGCMDSPLLKRDELRRDRRGSVDRWQRVESFVDKEPRSPEPDETHWSPTSLHPRAYQRKRTNRCLGAKRQDVGRWIYKGPHNWRFQETPIPAWARPLTHVRWDWSESRKCATLIYDKRRATNNSHPHQRKSDRKSDRIGRLTTSAASIATCKSDRAGATHHQERGRIGAACWIHPPAARRIRATVSVQRTTKRAASSEGV